MATALKCEDLGLTEDDLTEMSCGGEVEGWEEVTNYYLDSDRWHSYTNYVIQNVGTGLMYVFTVQRGLTEYQDCEPFSYGGPVLYRVEPTKVTKTVYVIQEDDKTRTPPCLHQNEGDE